MSEFTKDAHIGLNKQDMKNIDAVKRIMKAQGKPDKEIHRKGAIQFALAETAKGKS